MKKLIALALLTLAPFSMAGCGECVPSSAYTIPAHWTHGYYSQESYFDHWRYSYSCSYSYYNGYNHRTCSRYSIPVYHYYQQWHPAVYHPTEYVPAVVCSKSSS